MTQDVGLCLQVGFGNDDRYITGLVQHFATRISDAAEFARKHRMLLLRSSGNIAINVAFSGLEFETRMIARASLFPFAGRCSPLLGQKMG